MKRNALILTSALTAASLALPVGAFAESAQGQYGLIDYQLGIAKMPTSEAPMEGGAQSSIGAVNDGGSYAQYGIVDQKLGIVPVAQTSDGALPVPTLLKSSAGLAANNSAAGAKGAVITADGGAIGTIERVVPNGKTETVYVRVSDNIKDRTISMFKIDVPADSIHGGRLMLGWSMADLLDNLRGQA